MLRFFHGLAINLMPVLMRNEGEKLCDGGSVHVIQKVIMAPNGAAALHPMSGAAWQPPLLPTTHHGNYLTKTGIVCSTSLLHVGIFHRSRNTKLEQFWQLGCHGQPAKGWPKLG